MEIIDVEIDQLKPHPMNRRIYGHESLDAEFVQNVHMHGIIEPLLVTSDYTILSGHRRFAAAKGLGFEIVPVIIEDTTDDIGQLETILNCNKHRVKTGEQLSKEVKARMYVEGERAKQRQAEFYGNQHTGGLKENVPYVHNGQARDKVGESLGISGRQVDKLIQIADTVDSLESEGRAEEAEEIKSVLNNKSVAAAHKIVKEAKRAEAKPKQYITVQSWESMGEKERRMVLTSPRSQSHQFNKTNDNVEWAWWTWNPITGCLHNCPYCYARDIASRFYEQGFDPTFLPERLDGPKNTKVPERAEHEIGYRNVFTCSMADLFGKWVPQEWIDAVLGVMREQSQWNYLVLTKFPQRLSEQDWPRNTWAGASIDRQARVKETMKAFEKVKSQSNAAITWLSLEPLLEPLKFSSLSMFDMVVIGGASSSTQTPEFMPPVRWIAEIMLQADRDGCAVYLKTNGRPREYPGRKPSHELVAPSEFGLIQISKAS